MWGCWTAKVLVVSCTQHHCPCEKYRPPDPRAVAGLQCCLKRCERLALHSAEETATVAAVQPLMLHGDEASLAVLRARTTCSLATAVLLRRSLTNRFVANMVGHSECNSYRSMRLASDEQVSPPGRSNGAMVETSQRWTSLQTLVDTWEPALSRTFRLARNRQSKTQPKPALCRAGDVSGSSKDEDTMSPYRLKGTWACIEGWPYRSSSAQYESCP